GNLGQYLTHLLQKLVSLYPSRLSNDNSRRVAVEASVVGEHRHNVLGLIREITGTPRSRDNNDGADIAQLTSHPFRQLRSPLRFPCSTCWAWTEDNGIESFV